MEEVQYKVIKRFGPSVFKIKIPNEIVEKLNSYVDKVIEDKEKQKKLDFGNNLVGDVTQEFFLEPETVRETGWLNFLSKCVQRWVEIETGKKIKKFHLEQSWIVRQFQNEYNPTHWHSGHISGAGFLKVPNDFGKPVQKEKTRNLNGKLKMIHGNRQFLSQSMYVITPKVGDFYFFPHYLMHLVYPFSGTDEERRSISFNATVDQKVFNVFGG